MYARYFVNDSIVLEQNDTYQKQTYRNRADIYGANGKLSLIIPVKHCSGTRYKVKDIEIDYATDWRRLHWKGIVSAYNSSPFFEYYQDIFEPYYKMEFRFLIDLNLKLNDEVLKILSCSLMPKLSQEFIPINKSYGNTVISNNIFISKDLRDTIHPKSLLKNDDEFNVIKYTQVFEQKHGFIPNLSILDLIFNLGPESSEYLGKCMKDK